jgi:protoporphyrinogen oxidase
MHYAIIGGGVSGLIAANTLRLHDPAAHITLIEKSPQLGGLLGGIFYPERNLYFDQGTHIPRETGEPAIDDFMRGAIPPEMRIEYSVGKGDYAGSVFEGRLQCNSHFPTLHTHDHLKAIVSDLEAHVQGLSKIPQLLRTQPFVTAAERYFGKRYAHEVLAHIVEHMYQCPKSELAWFAAVLPGLTRAITQSEEAWQHTSGNECYRAILGFPEQRSLPDRYLSRHRSFYSKRHGSHAFIEGMARALRDKHVRILAQHTITHFNAGDIVLTCNAADGTEIKIQADHIINTTGIMGTAHLLGVDLSPYRMQKPKPVRILNYLAKHKQCHDIAYFYGLDTDTDFYRITNYQAVLGDVSDMRVTVEVIGERAESDSALTKNIAHQLDRIGFMEAANAECLGVHVLPNGFPLPTTHNFEALQAIREVIDNNPKRNITICGIGSEPDIFFQNEILLDTVKKIKSLFTRAEVA